MATPAASAATHPDTTVTGAGATFPLNMIEQWKADFKKSHNVTIAYTGVGSGAGRTQLIAGTVDFAGSDTLASAAETNQLKAKYGDFVYIPETSGGIAVMFKVSGLSSLKLSPSTLANIFAGTITNWNDAAIAADNGVPGPNKPIQVFVRQDKSRTSGVFKQPNAANVTAAIDDAVLNGDGSLGLNFTTSAAEAYPISTVSYFLVPTKMDDKKAENLKAFLA